MQITMRPLIPVFAAFIVGVFFPTLPALLGEPGDAPYEFSYELIYLLLAVSILAAIIAKKIATLRFLYIPPFFFLGLLFILPVLKPSIGPDHIINHVGKPGERLALSIEGRIHGPVQYKDAVTHIYLDTERAFPDGTNGIDVTGRVRLTVKGHTKELLGGDRVRVAAKLSRPRNLSNPGGFDYEWWLKRRSVLVTGYVRGEAFIKKISIGSGPFHLTELFRNRTSNFIDSLELSEEGVIKALLCGDKSAISAATIEAYRKSGAAHLLAISGLHTGTVALLAYLFFFYLIRRSEWLTLRLSARKLSLLLALPPVVFYAMISGLSLSTQRAAIMILAFVILILMGRGRNLLNTLALAALVILIISPAAAWEPSFQFSFAAVAGILYLTPRFQALFKSNDELEPLRERGWRHRAFHYLLSLFFVSLAATIATAPLAALHFNRVSIIGPLTNLIVIPIVAFLVVPVLLIAGLLSALWPALAALIFKTVNAVLIVNNLFIDKISHFQWSSLWLSTPTLVELFFFYLMVIAIAEIGRRRYMAYAVAACISILFIIPVQREMASSLPNELAVTFLSVGQGDAAFVELPGGKTMLIDGGGAYGKDLDMGRLVIAPFLRKKRIRHIDYMALSHAQRDHMAGLPFIAENFSIGEFWWNGQGPLKELGKILEREAIQKRVVNKNTDPMTINGVKIEFLHPGPEKSGSVNDNSLVLRLSYKDRAILFTGDIGELVEPGLLDKNIKADILKAPHHGSRSSSSIDFLRAIGAEYVVVSAGYANYFGFPHTETVERYRQAETRILRTDLEGAVTVRTDGSNLKIKSYLTGPVHEDIIRKDGL